MRVFNTYMKIIKKNFASLAIYTIVFIIITISMTMITNKNQTDTFEQVKTKIAFFDNDNTNLSNDLKKRLEKIADFIEIEDDEQELKDALFFRKINAIIRIEKGFTEDLLQGNDVNIEMNSIPNTYANYYVEMAINSYVGAIQSYGNYTNYTEAEIIEKVSEDLTHTTQIELTTKKEATYMQTTTNYFIYLYYILAVSLILGIGMTMSTFNQKNLRRRTIVSKLSNRKMNLELTLGHIVYSFSILAILLVALAIIIPQAYTDARILLFTANAVCITLTILAISFFIGSTVKNKTAQNAVANVIGLGTSFISGIFVPIELLSEGVQKIASFTPSYWYVNATKLIESTNVINFESLKPILQAMGIQLAFAATFWFVSLVISKHKRTSND